MVPLGVSAVEPEVADELGLSEVVEELDEVSDEVLDSDEEEEVSLEVDGWVELEEEVLVDDELVTVVSLLLQAVRPSAPTRTIEPNATRFRMAVLDMVFSPCWFVTELRL